MTCKKMIKENNHCSDFPEKRCIEVPLTECKYIEQSTTVQKVIA